MDGSLVLYDLGKWDILSRSREPSVIEQKEKSLIIGSIKIKPGSMIFKDAYDGKAFNQTLTITNCGKKSVVIRIFPPTSKAFKIKPILQGHTLSSGLSIVRKIKYLYTKPTAIPQTCMDVYINNNCIRYEIIVLTCYTQISIYPRVLDFGDIDVGNVSEVKKLSITNSGTKQAHFSIDLGRNQLELIVKPIKGTVQPNESKEITVEVFGTSEGPFQQEFWIKTDPLQRVQIQGHFISPTLVVDYPISDIQLKNFVVLNFPKTFVGVRQQKNVVLKNHSSLSTVFCVMGVIKSDRIPFATARGKDTNFKQFEVFPVEGKLHSDQKCLLGVTFTPRKTNRFSSYYICELNINIVKCRTGKTLQLISDSHDSQIVGPPPLLDTVSVCTIDDQNDPDQEVTCLDNFVSIYLYGEVETPQILLEPEKVSIENLKINEVHEVVLKMVNKSQTLSVTCKYNKIACIDVVPKEFELPPSKVVDAILRIRPAKMGQESARIVFDLFYVQNIKNYTKLGLMDLDVFYSVEYMENVAVLKRKKPCFLPGITPKITHEVGFLVDDVRYNSKIEKPTQAIVDKHFLRFDKANDALVAFPNDRPQCLRPWRNKTPCNTIFANLPRTITDIDANYDLTPEEKLLKESSNSYYKNYIRNMSNAKKSKKLDEEVEDYVVTNQKLILMENHQRNGAFCPPNRFKNISKEMLFVPLTSYELYNVVISPKFIHLGMLAAHSECSNFFTLENKNTFPIHVSLKALYSSLTQTEEEFIVLPKTSKKIWFTYRSEFGGNFHVPVYIVVNFFHVYDLTVLANIVSNTVKCVTKQIFILPTEKVAFLELKNPLNSAIKFKVETKFYHLESYPSCGVIPAKKNMACTITFFPQFGYIPVKEIVVLSESGAKDLVDVCFEHKKATVALSSDNIVFKDIPLKTLVTQELIIKNLSDQLVPVTIDLEDEFPELSISPAKALIAQKGDIVVRIAVYFTDAIKFDFPAKVMVQYEYPVKIRISGNVVFPDVSFLPEFIKIPKIPSGAMVKTSFKVYSNSSVRSVLSFPLSDYPEFIINDKTGNIVNDKNIYLDPEEKMEFYLKFYPHEPVAYCIYLPFILNSTFGPPELNDPESLMCKSYVPLTTDKYRCPEDTGAKLKFIKILCAAGKPILNFNCMSIHFSSHDRLSKTFQFTNSSDVEQMIFVRATDLGPFTLESVARDVNGVQFVLKPKDSIEFLVGFESEAYGEFKVSVPIFMESYSETIAFNYLELYGINPEPKLVPDTKVVYFPPIPSYSNAERDVSITFLDHNGCSSRTEIECLHNSLSVSFLKEEQISEFEKVTYYRVVFKPQKVECKIESKVTFSCPCSQSADILVKALSDNAILINFLTAPTIAPFSTYPYFPNADDNSPYSKLMHSIVPVVERWLYSQGFFYQNYYRIPDDIARYPVETSQGEKKKGFAVGKKDFPQLPLVQLLINLMNTSILKFIDNGIFPSENLKERTLYNYVTYRNTISFLKSQTIFVPGLKPEHLLPYQEYQEFVTSFIDKEREPLNETFSEEQFYLFSKQKWMDLFFHLYKVLVLERVVDPKAIVKNKEKDDEFIVQDREKFNEYYEINKGKFTNWYKCDIKLLLWLEYHYNIEKHVLWPNETFENQLQLEKLNNIRDSLVLATVTVAYCPYLKDKLSDLYAFPKNEEQLVHNACRVVQSWKSLGLSFDIHPQAIVQANKIKILLIVTYLFEVLPHYYPTNFVTIEAPLSESTNYELSVQNYGEVAVQYNAIFFGDNSGIFELDSSQITVPMLKTRKIKLTYFAKRVLKASTILVLSGEGMGQKYARSMAVAIEGIPRTSSCEEMKVQVETYKRVKKKLAISTPYGKNYVAKIFVCFKEPKYYKDLHSVVGINQKNLPREFTVVKPECEFVEKGEGTVVLEMCFLAQGTTSFYLYLCNEEFGDFCVLLQVNASDKKKNVSTDIFVNLGEGFRKRCVCKKGLNMRCPKTFVVQIPCKNGLFWESINTMLKTCLTEEHYNFWKRYLGTPLLFRMLKFYLEKFSEGFLVPTCILDDSAEYTIQSNKKTDSIGNTVKINDVTSEESVPLILHWSASEMPSEEYLELRNINEKEVRYYRLIFPKLSLSSGGTGNE